MMILHTRRRILLLWLLLLLVCGLTAGQKADQPLRRIVFGSCADQNEPQPIWNSILAAKPDIFLSIGDIVYVNDGWEKHSDRVAAYAKISAIPAFAQLRRTVPFLATWDDGEFGVNDGGWDFKDRDEFRADFLDFLGESKDSPRRTRAGLYDAKIFGPPAKRVQIILLDMRYNRSPLKREAFANPDVEGRYVPDSDPKKTMLGAEQWKWFEVQLRQPAEIRLIVSSIQVIPEDHHWETWANLPLERQRLFQLLRSTDARGVIFLSGDRHLAELSMMDGGVGYPLFDLTSSGLNKAHKEKWREQEPNRHRVATMNLGDNFGVVEIDWALADPRISMQIRDVDGDITIQRKIPLSLLQPGNLGK